MVNLLNVQGDLDPDLINTRIAGKLLNKTFSQRTGYAAR